MPARRAPAAPTQLDSYVLHRWDWSESSLILDLFTRERGRVAVVAKGAKRPYSQLRSVLLPFQRASVSLGKQPADASGEIHLLRHAEWVGGGPLLPPAALFQGFYLNELVMKMLARQDPHPALFDAYVDTLPALAMGDDLLAHAGLRAFELLLLRETGVLPELDVTTLGQQALNADGAYVLRAETGVAPVQGEGPALSGRDLLALQQALQGPSVAELQRACAECLSALRPMLRQLLHYHLGTATLRTREVMHSVQRLLDSATAVANPPLSRLGASR